MAQNPLSTAFSLGAALAAATRRRLAFARLLPFAPLPRGDGTAFRRGLHAGRVGDSAEWELTRTAGGSIVNTHGRVNRSFFPGVAGMARPLSFWASPAWRAHFLYHWRVEPGTRTVPILGHRVVRVRWYPARFLKFCRRHGGEPHLPATGPTLRSGAGLDLGGVGGGGMPPPVALAAPAELS
ncbi:unnamed protein product [Pelagomonas calceolata]|uniref:Uncharacterized protein n=1 Tax=Pelagomonas calceolata TaxID=35677 RepID=A0A8J2X3Z8_9STRA|nr:unnamed protein product [Pelagomonas calceolata]